MKRLLALLCLLSTSALAADNIPVTVGSGTPIRSTDTSAGATGAGPYVNWYTLSTSGAAGTAPVVLYAPSGSSNTFGVNIQGVTGGIAVPVSGTVTATPTGTYTVTGTVTANQGSPPWTVNPGTPANWGIAATGAAVPANGILNGMSQGGNLTALTGTAGSLNVNCTAGCTSTGGTSSTFGVAFPSVGTAIGVQSGANMIAWPAKAANTVANTDVVPEVAVANAAAPGRTTTGLAAQGASPVVQPSAPNTATGGTAFPIVNATSSANATLIKNAAAVVFGCQMGNNSTTIAYLHIFNKATAPTPGTDSAIKTLIIPGPAAGGGGSNVNFGPGGIALGTGFGITITGGIGTIDNTTIATANTVVVNCDFE